MGVSNLLLLILLDSFSNHSVLNHCFTHSLQAFNQLEIVTHIEMVASMLHRDATQIIKTVLAGTATEKLTNVLEAAFGEEESPELRKAYEEALEEEEEEEEEGPIEELAPSTSKGGKRKQSAPRITKGAKVSKPGPCSLESASIYYPTTADEGSHLHSGVDPKFLSSRKSSHHTAAAGYGCLFSEVCKSKGKVVPHCDFISTAKGQLSTHVRQQHLNLAIGCNICQKKWWSAATWMDHMRRSHSEVGADAFFVKEGGNPNIAQVKEEVMAGDI